VRLFLAINLPPDVRAALAVATTPLRDIAPDLSWVAEDRLHLTLKFLGEQAPERAAEVGEAVAAVATRHRAFAADLGGVGAFPNFRRAHVVWIGVAHEARLELLHHDVELACERLGFEIEGKTFRPHLTLARVKRHVDEDTLRALARAAKTIDYHHTFSVESVDLMQSDLSSAPARYTTLAAVPLRTS
jgi:2'-5' RNA ligase